MDGIGKPSKLARSNLIHSGDRKLGFSELAESGTRFRCEWRNDIVERDSLSCTTECNEIGGRLSLHSHNFEK